MNWITDKFKRFKPKIKNLFRVTINSTLIPSYLGEPMLEVVRLQGHEHLNALFE